MIRAADVPILIVAAVLAVMGAVHVMSWQPEPPIHVVTTKPGPLMVRPDTH